MYLQESKQGTKTIIHPYLIENGPLNKDDPEPPIHPALTEKQSIIKKDSAPIPVWMEKEPQPVPPPVYQEPHDEDGSKPSVDEDQMEKELLDLLQRKFADD